MKKLNIIQHSYISKTKHYANWKKRSIVGHLFFDYLLKGKGKFFMSMIYTRLKIKCTAKEQHCANY